MKKELYFALSMAIVAAFARCSSSEPVSETALRETLYQGTLSFVNEALPSPLIPADVGGRTENPADETGVVRTAFRDAYLEALFRGVQLRGILGSDRVNPWPDGEPLTWSQNWNKAEGEPNSWGIPNLVLALGYYPALAELPGLSAEESVLERVFIVHGPILDMYGKSFGYARSNGVTGYGFPLGEVVFSEGRAVQRFSRGRMIVSAEGTRFSFEDDSFTSLLENLGNDEMETEFGGADIAAGISEAFAYAWAITFSEKEGLGDGPLNKVTFSRPWILDASGEEISVNGFFYKSYNKGRDVLILLDSPDLPRRVHLLSGPFLEAILSGKRLPGLKAERRLGSSAGSGLGKSLADGFAMYGPPLSDPLPLSAPDFRGEEPRTAVPLAADMPGKERPFIADAGNGTETSGEAQTSAAPSGGDPEAGTSQPMFLQAQRFARGWMIAGE